MKIKSLKLNSTILYTLVAIIVGIIVGGIVLSSAGYNPIEAYDVILNGIFSKPKYISYTIIYATPLIMTGLSVAFAFKTGLFNIGAEGQFIMGALTAALAGYFLKLPPILHAIVVILLAMFVSGIWGGIAGYLKSKFGVHEVISTIMLNWIALYMNNFMLSMDSIRKPNSETTHYVLDSSRIDLLWNWKSTDAGIAFLSNHPILKDVLRTPANFGILVAIILAVAVYFILKKTTLGYELRAVGFNKDAAEYGGIDVSKKMTTAMVISGAIAGCAGAAQVLGETHNVAILATMQGYGFDGIAVSLIASNNPFGCIFSGLLYGAFKYGGTKIQSTLGAPGEVVNIIIGTIIFFVAMPKLTQVVMEKFKSLRKKGGENHVG